MFEEYLLEDISEVEFEYLLAHGMRHFGDYFFRPRCKDCYRCIPIRVRVGEFKTSRTQKRALQSCREVGIRVGPPRYSREKFDLYLKHKRRFNVLNDDVEDEQNFRLSFYVNTVYGIEFEYYLAGRLIGTALADHTQKTFSAIYTFYDSPQKGMSLGTYSILKQLEFCRERGIQYFYLGYYIADNKSLSYKSGFRPNELYIDQKWHPFRNVRGDVLIPDKKLAWENTDFLVKAAHQTEYT